VVQLIFQAEEGARRAAVAAAAFGQRADVAAGAEAAALGMVDQHGFHRLVLAPGEQGCDQGLAHRIAERMERLRPG
jgi:hypothetical protein